MALHDIFAGTAGTTIVGRVPAPVRNGSDSWALGQDGSDTLAIVSGGSGVASTGSASNWSASYPMTGASTDQVITTTLAMSGSGIATWNIRCDGPLNNALIITVDLEGSGGYIVNTFVEGTFTAGDRTGIAVPTGTPFDVVMTLSGTTLGMTVNGASAFSGMTVPAAVGPGIYLRQQGGSAGDVVFQGLEIQVAGPSSATLSGPTSGTSGSASSAFTVTLDASDPSDSTVVTLSDSSSGGSFAGAHVSGTALTIPANSTSDTFTYTPASPGTDPISISSSPLTISGSPISYVASGPSPTTATVTGPSSITVGVTTSIYTVTLNHPAGGGGVSFAPSSTGFSISGSTPSPVVIASGSSVGTFTVTPTSAGSGSIGGVASSLTVTPQSATSAEPVPTTATLATSPNTGITGVESSPVVVTLDLPAPDGGVTILIGETGTGDVFRATSGGPGTTFIAIAAGSRTGSFYILPGPAGTRGISISSSGLSVANSPLSFVVSAPSATVALLSGPTTGTAGEPSSSFTVTLNSPSPQSTTVTLSDSSSGGSFAGAHVSGTTLTIPANSASDTFTYTRATSGSSLISISSSGLSISGSPIGYAAAPSATASFLTAVSGFATGLVGGTTSGFGFKVSLNGGSYGSLITSGIREDTPGSYSSISTCPSGSLVTVKWSDGSGNILIDYAPQFLPGASGGGGFTSDPWATVIPAAYGVGTAGYLLGGALVPLILSNATATAFTLDPLDPLNGTSAVGSQVYIYNATSGGGQTATIDATNLGVTPNRQTIAGWSNGITPTGASISYLINPTPNSGGGGGGGGVATDSGAVTSQPQPPTTSTFYATGGNLRSGSGGYNGMSVRFQQAGKANIRRGVASHTRVGDLHYFVLAQAAGIPLPAPPADQDIFIIE